VNYTSSSDGRGYPYDYNTSYKVVSYGMTRGLVMVPIATALAFIAMIMFIFGSYRMKAWADYVSKLVSCKRMSLLIKRLPPVYLSWLLFWLGQASELPTN